MTHDAPKLSPSRLARIRRRAAMLPRRVHVYGVGTAKSGTTSLAHMLKALYRAAHEPGVEGLLPYVYGDRRRAPPEEIRRFLRTRDRRMRLEVEANQLLCPFAGELAQLFPDALFVHTIRDCYSFLESLVNHRRTRARGVWADYDEGGPAVRPRTHAPEEGILAEHALPTVDELFAYWARYNQCVLDGVPEERLLSIRTPDLDASAGRIADFLGIPPDHVDRGRSRRNVADRRPFRLSLIDRDFLADRAQEHCMPLMRRFFPEIKQPPAEGA